MLIIKIADNHDAHYQDHWWPWCSLSKSMIIKMLFVETIDDHDIHYQDHWWPWCPLLTQCGLVTPYGNISMGQHWFRLWLVAWRQQAISWTNIVLSSARSNDVHLMAISKQITLPSIDNIPLKINNLRCHSNLPGTKDSKTTRAPFINMDN